MRSPIMHRLAVTALLFALSMDYQLFLLEPLLEMFHPVMPPQILITTIQLMPLLICFHLIGP